MTLDLMGLESLIAEGPIYPDESSAKLLGGLKQLRRLSEPARSAGGAPVDRFLFSVSSGEGLINGRPLSPGKAIGGPKPSNNASPQAQPSGD
jgi:hypothetical protein